MKYMIIIILTLAIQSVASGQTTSIYEYDKYGFRHKTGEMVTEHSRRSEYVSGMPSYELIMAVGRMKQERFDARREWFQSQVDRVETSITRLFFKNGYDDEGIALSDKLEAFIRKFNNGRYDLSEDRIFRPLAAEINSLQDEVYDRYDFVTR